MIAGAVLGMAGVFASSSVFVVLGIVCLLAAGASALRSTAEQPAPVSPSLDSPSSPKVLIESVLEECSPGCVAVHLWLDDELTATLRPVAAAGTRRPIATPVPRSGSIMADALDGDEVLFAPVQHVRTAQSETVWRLVAPIRCHGCRGVLGIDVTDESKRAGLTEVVDRWTPALSQALQILVETHRAETAEALVQTASALFRLVDPREVAEQLLASVVELAHADTGSIMVFDEAEGVLRIVCAQGLPADVIRDTRLAPGEGIAGWVYSSASPMVVEDLEGREQGRRHGVTSAMAVPLADEDGVVGVINVGSKVHQPRDAEALLGALGSLGRIGAVAMRNARATHEQADAHYATLRALAVALETKDPYSRGASEHVHDVAMALGRALGMRSHDLGALRAAALLHDVGMSAVTPATPAEPLSTVEWGLIKAHPRIARDILSEAPALRDAVPIVFHHHEHFDGNGYASGLSGAAIPLGARVLSVADAYVAMLSQRPYRSALTPQAALSEIESRSGSQFDPRVVGALRELATDGTLEALSTRQTP